MHWEPLPPCSLGALSCPVSALPSSGVLDRPELEPCHVGTTGPGWSDPTRAPRAELDAATMATVLARATGAELGLFDARTTGAELDAA